MKKNEKKTLLILLLIVVSMIFIPFFMRRGAEFGGTDDAGSQMVEEIEPGYEPWFTPVLESVIGGELPGEVESLLFCLQTGIGVGIMAFFFGRFVERKKWTDEEMKKEYPPHRE